MTSACAATQPPATTQVNSRGAEALNPIPCPYFTLTPVGIRSGIEAIPASPASPATIGLKTSSGAYVLKEIRIDVLPAGVRYNDDPRLGGNIEDGTLPTVRRILQQNVPAGETVRLVFDGHSNAGLMLPPGNYEAGFAFTAEATTPCPGTRIPGRLFGHGRLGAISWTP